MKAFLLSLSVLLSLSIQAQVDYFPPLIGNTWDTLSISELGWCEAPLDELYSFLEDGDTKAFLVLKDGKIVLEKYFGDTEITSSLPWNSAGKTITSLMVGIAQENELLSIQHKTSDYLGTGWTSLTPEQEDVITIRHQLTMTSGLDDTESFCVTPECLTYLADAGTRWAYHNGPYTLLQDVIEEASGTTMNNYTLLNLKLQTGINGIFIPLGNNKVFFGPARGMARMGLLMLNQGTWNNTVVLGDMDYYNQMINTSQDINLAYGYLWWLNGSSSFMLPGSQIVFPGSHTPYGPPDLYAGVGKNGQFLDIIPSENLVVIRMGGAPDNDPVPLAFHNEMWSYLSQIICQSTATEEAMLPNQIKLFPNPFDETLHIESEFKIKSVRLYNSLGQLMLEQDDVNELHGGQLATGVYWLELKDQQNRSVIKKVIKN